MHRRIGAEAGRGILAAFVALSAWTAAGQEALPGSRESSFDAGDVDLGASVVYADGKPGGHPSIEQVQAAIGQGRFDPTKAWSAGPAAATRVDFVLVFKKPVVVGTVITETYAGPERRALQVERGRFVSLLKAEAPGADPSRAESWQVLHPGEVKTLDRPATTRAVRITRLSTEPVVADSRSREDRLWPVLFVQGRYFSPHRAGSESRQGKPPTESWLQSWADARPIRAVAVFVEAESGFLVRALPASVPVSPPLAVESNWVKVAESRVSPGAQWVSARPSGATRALRLSGPQSRHGGPFGLAIPLSRLEGDEAVPAAVEPAAPYAIRYDMPVDGFAAVHIYNRGGDRLVRRLVAEVAKEKGPTSDGWDLRDDAGNHVAPGEYVWKALTRPPFKLTYELTVNNAGQPAWPAPPPGKGGGGWLGDHGTPNCAAAMGDRMWFGTLCAEGGHVAIATDLDGNKQWGTPSIATGFRGPMYIACDETAAYLVTPELVNRVVPSRDFQMRQVFSCEPDPLYPWMDRGYEVAGGAAARNGKLYWAIQAAPDNWLASTFRSEDLDPLRCLPAVGLLKGKGHRSGRGETNYGESEYDELMKLYATFLTGKTPDAGTPTIPSTMLPSSTQASFGEAPSSGAMAGSVVVVFKKPVTVGSVLIPDARIAVYALKPGIRPAEVIGAGAEAGGLEAGMDAEDGRLFEELGDVVEELADGKSADGHWIRLRSDPAGPGPGLAVAPGGGLKTEALRYRTRRLVYSQVIGRRMTNVAARAARVLGEGQATPAGGWKTQRTAERVLCKAAPATVALVWPEAQSLRGLSFSHPVVGEWEVSAWKGEAGDPGKALTDEARWEPLAALKPEPKFVGYFPQDPTCRHVEFGRVLTNRAIRIKVTAGVDNAAGFDGVVAWTPAGDDPPDLPVRVGERIAVLEMPPLDDDTAEARVVQNIPLPKPGALAFGPGGDLFAISDRRLVKVPLDGKQAPVVVVPQGQLEQPMGLAVDGQGQCYVSDLATCTIKVFDSASGKLARVIGAGRQAAGPWDPARLDRPMQVAVDPKGRVWVADASYQPKRIMRFAADGRPDRWFLGPAAYGGGGWLDEGDRTRLYYNGMEFRIDWATREWRLDSLVHRSEDPRCLAGAAAPDRPVYFKGRRYLVGPDLMGHGLGRVAVICEERDRVALPMAAIGMLQDWEEIDRREDLTLRYGATDRTRRLFVWSDLNGDRRPQVDEVQTRDLSTGATRTWIVGEDLTLYAVGYRLTPASFRADGVPVYDLAKLGTFDPGTRGPGARTETLWGAPDGRIFVIGTRLIAPDGKTQLWEYYNEFAYHAGFYGSRFGYDRPAGVLNQEHRPIGRITVGAEEYFFSNTDPGDWYCYSSDGFLVGCVFGGPAGYGLRRWTMPEWTPGQVDLSDVRLSQEHYQGCVVKADDGKVYAVAGKNDINIVRVDGFDGVKRLQGTTTVTAEDLARTREWEVKRALAIHATQERKGMRIPLLKRPLKIDGALTVWPPDLFVTVYERWTGTLTLGPILTDQVKGALAYSPEYLYVAVKAADDSPMKNAAVDPIRLFQGGDAVDVTLGLDPDAEPGRSAPGSGDLRVLMTLLKGDKPTAVLYRPVSPDSPASRHAAFESPVGRTVLDEVRVIPEAKVAVQKGYWEEVKSECWTLTAAIPWAALGVPPPKPGVLLRGDIGVLRSDPNGVMTASRVYWSGKTQTVVCDAPSEARLIPALWGEVVFEEDALLDAGTLDDGQDERFAPDEPDFGGLSLD